MKLASGSDTSPILLLKMVALRFLIAVVGLASLAACVTGESCKSPRLNSQSYTTTDATVVVNLAFIAEFTVACANSVKNLNLYADLNGKIVPVTKSQEGGKYQVSWTEDPKKVSSGEHPVKIFDEEGYAALRKAQRSGEDTAGISPLFTVAVTHPESADATNADLNGVPVLGTYNGPWVQSEFMAAAVTFVVWYAAYSAKSKLLA